MSLCDPCITTRFFKCTVEVSDVDRRVSDVPTSCTVVQPVLSTIQTVVQTVRAVSRWGRVCSFTAGDIETTWTMLHLQTVFL